MNIFLVIGLESGRLLSNDMVITFVPCVAIWIQEFCIQSAFSVFCCKWSLIPINIPLNNSVFFHNLNLFGNIDCTEIFVHSYWVCNHAFPVVCGLTDIFQLYFTGNRKIVASPLTALQVNAWMSGYIKRETKLWDAITYSCVISGCYSRKLFYSNMRQFSVCYEVFSVSLDTVPW